MTPIEGLQALFSLEPRLMEDAPRRLVKAEQLTISGDGFQFYYRVDYQDPSGRPLFEILSWQARLAKLQLSENGFTVVDDDGNPRCYAYVNEKQVLLDVDGRKTLVTIHNPGFALGEMTIGGCPCTINVVRVTHLLEDDGERSGEVVAWEGDETVPEYVGSTDYFTNTERVCDLEELVVDYAGGINTGKLDGVEGDWLIWVEPHLGG